MRERIFSNIDLIGRLGCAMASLANAILELQPVRLLMEKTVGLSAKRSLPHYTHERFDRWFARRKVDAASSRVSPNKSGWKPLLHSRRHVVLWDDTFVRYHEPHIGIAATKVLEALGFQVSLVKNRRCCGRPAFSQGNLDLAAKLGKHNVDLLSSLQYSTTPILFLEPSCYSMFLEEYRELKIAKAETVTERCFLFEKFVDETLQQKPDSLRLNYKPQDIAIHAHCHAKSLMNPLFMTQLAERLPGRKATLLNTGCCGMAGAFGALASKYELSLKVAEQLIEQVNNQSPETEIVASGTSCRHQIMDLTAAKPKHMAELIAEALS
jgi:Fe-S oxidoreductase